MHSSKNQLLVFCRKFIWCLLVLLSIGCRYTQKPDRPLPAMPFSAQTGEGECYFIANTSPVDFDDLICVSASEPRMEGFFDACYPMSDFDSRMKGTFSASNPLVLEAEWLLVFDRPIDPLQAEFVNAKAVKLALISGSLQVALTGMAEGKWLGPLSDEVNGRFDRYSNDWVPASSGNNFYVTAGAMTPNRVLLGDGFVPMRTFMDRLDTGYYDGFSVRIDYAASQSPDENSRRKQLAAFSETRADLFNTTTCRNDFGSHPFSKIIFAVIDAYFDKSYSETRKHNPLRGINFGAHGSRAAHVNEGDRRVYAYPKAQLQDFWFDLFRFVPRRLPIWMKREIARGIIHQEAYIQPDSVPAMRIEVTPEICTMIDIELAKILSRQHELNSVIACIESEPQVFKSWRFDGASMIPDGFVSRITQAPDLTEIALRHDLKYAYGKPGDEDARRQADEEFRQEIRASGAGIFSASAMYWAIRLFGGGEIVKTHYTWGFARK